MSLDRETLVRAAGQRVDILDIGKPLGRHSSVPGWVTNGWFAARTDVVSDLTAELDCFAKAREMFDDWEARLAAIGVAVVEDVTLRIATVPVVDCAACHGEGVCACGCDVEHDCRTCRGSGTANPKRADLGQSVYRSDDGVTTVIQEVFGRLLDGFRTVRFGADADGPILGLDESGRVMVGVMPLREAVRVVPKAKEATP